MVQKRIADRTIPIPKPDHREILFETLQFGAGKIEPIMPSVEMNLMGLIELDIFQTNRTN